MTMEGVVVGSVLHMYSYVASKEKFHVVCCLDPKPLAFLINSELTEFVKKKQELVACNVVIECGEHGFLRYNSYVACCEPVSLVGVEPAQYSVVGQVSDTTRKAITRAVGVSPLIVRRQKKWILTALS